MAALSKEEVIQAAMKSRRELVRANDEVNRELARLYTQAYKAVRERLNNVTALIRDARAEGLDVSPAWLIAQSRYIELMDAIRRELTYFSWYANIVIPRQKDAAIELALSHTEELTRLQMPGLATWSRPAFEATEKLVNQLADGSPLSYKFADLPDWVATGIKDKLVEGMLAGDGPRKMARDVKAAYGDGLTNTLLTCRTEVMRAYRTAASECYQANKPVMRGWVWVSAQDSITCSACWSMDGTFHKITEVMSSHPACRCICVPVTKNWQSLGIQGVDETAAEPGWDSTAKFDKLPEDVKLRLLGPTKLRLYQEGKIGIRDLGVRERSRVWGDTYRPVTIKELVSNGKIKLEDLK
jgi:SPP1 gp7 family putative phage head morphogenesis protein